MANTLLLISGPSCSGGFVDDALNHHQLNLRGVHVCSDSSLDGRVKHPQFQSAVVASSSDTVPVTVVAAVTRQLSPGASVSVHIPSGSSQDKVAALRSALLMGGLATSDATAATASSVVVTATKPGFEVGAKSALRLKPAAAVAPAAPATKTWALSTDVDDDDALIDDEELLTEEDKMRPVVPSGDDCEVGKAGRKACKNCSCGRAEAEEAAATQVKLTPEMLDNPTSACGSCYLGDAFRCAGCPYKGLPAFEPGKKIQISQDFLTADA